MPEDFGETLSQAEYLESLVPQSANVVKAFNVLSAYSLESGGIQGIYIFYVNFAFLLINSFSGKFSTPFSILSNSGSPVNNV